MEGVEIKEQRGWKKKETVTEAKPNIFCHTCRLVMKAMSWGLKPRHLKKTIKKPLYGLIMFCY